MAVNWGSLIFGGVDSSEYGIYLSGEGVYNAPERAVEVVDVPGRNGSVIIDQGHWNNIEVVYRAGVFGADQAGFSEKLSAFRNAILSQTGYQRLSDTYHPEEFRMGAYVSGLEVSPANYNRHGEFELIFNCKPQRWLVDGDLLVPLDSGDVLQNPTEYESSPLLHISGYGSVEFNGYDIDISASEPLGEVALSAYGGTGWPSRFDSASPSGTIVNTFTAVIDLYQNLMVAGDPFILPQPDGSTAGFNLWCTLTAKAEYAPVANTTISSVSSGMIVKPVTGNTSKRQFEISFDPDVVSFVWGTASTYTGSFNVMGTIGSGDTFAFTYRVTLDYDGNHTLTISQQLTNYGSSYTLSYWAPYQSSKGVRTASPVTGYSTLPAYGDLVIDCDLGEAWKVVDGELVPLNSIIDLGSDLPTLAPGSNTVTFDNTISDLKMAPRWWKL